jgi:hypothetical protein
MANAKVDIVRVNNPANWEPGTHHAVEEEGTERLLFESASQDEAISWAKQQGLEINIHRERNRKPGDRHGRFRAQ